MQNINLRPPLRLVLNTNCNGICYFCHHEGCDSTYAEMSYQVLSECIDAARQLHFSKISLTGGEPTLRNDLAEIVGYIKTQLPTIELSITTNGYHLCSLPSSVLKQIDKINLSVSSFSEVVYSRYQRVSPFKVFEFLRTYSDKTTVNIVVVNDNKNELISLIDQCFKYGFCVDLMFELISNDLALQKAVLKTLTKTYGLFDISYSSTPVMKLCTFAEKRLRIKAPCLSSIITRDVCTSCPHYETCPEKVCSLRVYPDGTVTPCLNRFVQSKKSTVFERIEELTPLLNVRSDNLYAHFFH